MAGVGVTTKNEVKYYYSTDAGDIKKKTSEINAALITSVKGAQGANEIACVMGVSDIGQSASTIEYSCHGEQATRKIAGTPSTEDLELTILADFTNAKLNSLLALALNTEVAVVVDLILGDGQTSFYVVGRMAGWRFVVNEDAPNQVVVTIAPDLAHRLDKP